MSKPPPGFLVNFVVGGTQKGGTTALARFLAQHPEVCFSKHKEAHFFDRPDFLDAATVQELNKRYARAFPKERAGKILGEATPIYMYLPGVPERIRAYNAAMKWVLVLRHPVERAVSQYSMERARGFERLPLAWALRAEPWRCWYDKGWTAARSSVRDHSYLARGRYCAQIERLWRLFGREQVLVLIHEALRDEHAKTLGRVYEFLGLRDRGFMPTPEKVFATEQKIAVDQKTRAWMLRQFESEVTRLETMLEISLEGWRR